MPASDVLLEDLVIQLFEQLRLLTYPTYRVRLHSMLTELVAYHRPTLRDDVAALAEHTLDLLTPGTPDLAAAELAQRRWTEILDEDTSALDVTDHAKWYNARTLLWMLRLVHTELSEPRYRPMNAYVGDALVGWQIRPMAPSETSMPQRADTVVADPDSLEVQTLMRFIAATEST